MNTWYVVLFFYLLTLPIAGYLLGYNGFFNSIIEHDHVHITKVFTTMMWPLFAIMVLVMGLCYVLAAPVRWGENRRRRDVES